MRDSSSGQANGSLPRSSPIPRSERASSIPAAVCWYDGMPLAPQHFQDAARRTERLLDFHLDMVSPYHYGVVTVDIEGAKLVGKVLHVSVQAIMPDRLWVDRTEERALTRSLSPADLRKEATADQSHEGNNQASNNCEIYTIYLVANREFRRHGARNTEPRFERDDGEMLADELTGDSEIEISRLQPRVKLEVTASTPKSGIYMPIGQLKLEGASFSLTDYIPPMLTVSREEPSQNQDGKVHNQTARLFRLCADLVQHLREEAWKVAQRLAAIPKDEIERVTKAKRQIYHLTAALPVFEAMLFTNRSHPLQLYLGLAAILGQLTPIGTLPVPDPVLPYSHDNLHVCFIDLEHRIRRIVRDGIRETYEEHPFTLDPKSKEFCLKFKASWVEQKMVFAVRAEPGTSQDSMKAWVKGAVIASREHCDEAAERRTVGVERDELDPKGEDLVPTPDEMLFSLDKKALASQFPKDEVMVVFNRTPEAKLPRPCQVVLYVDVTNGSNQDESSRAAG